MHFDATHFLMLKEGFKEGVTALDPHPVLLVIIRKSLLRNDEADKLTMFYLRPPIDLLLIINNRKNIFLGEHIPN